MDAMNMTLCKERLLFRRRQLLTALRRLDEEKRELSGRHHFDWLDQAWDASEIRLADRLDAMYRTELGKIDMALERIVAGRYGLCKACHHPIEKRRLDSFPETDFCVSCQDLREALERI